MTTTIAIRSCKGGQGTTTFVAALATQHDGPVIIVGPDRDLPAVFGMANDHDGEPFIRLTKNVTQYPDPKHWAAHVSVSGFDHPGALVIAVGDADPGEIEMTYLVIRPDYLALRAAVHETTWRADEFVLFDEKDRALGVRDVQNVLGIPCAATVPISAATARAVDAGVVTIRCPTGLKRAAQQLLSGVVPVEA